MTGDLPGTLRYMSPEQALGKRSLVDRRTDIYALGATLYELLALRAGRGPGSDKQEILRRIADDEPEPLRRLNPAVPRRPGDDRRQVRCRRTRRTATRRRGSWATT